MYKGIVCKTEKTKHFFKSKEINSKKFFNKFIKPLMNKSNQDWISKQRKNYLDLLMIKLHIIPKDIAEMTFNLFHVAFLLEEEIKIKIKNCFDEEDAVFIFCENSMHYLFFTCLLIVSKLCGCSNYYAKVKELIIDMNLHFNTILLCEILLMNFVEWEIFLFSPSDVIYSTLTSVGVSEEAFSLIGETVENYVNYAFSEYLIYSSFDQYVIAISVCKLLLDNVNFSHNNNYISDDTCGRTNHVNSFLFKFESFISEIECNKEEIQKCVDLIYKLLEEPEEENEVPQIEIGALNRNELTQPIVF